MKETIRNILEATAAMLLIEIIKIVAEILTHTKEK